ncbi:hypothetical protein JCM8547_003455 [Rhodosporidiobolus lusitaniae]
MTLEWDLSFDPHDFNLDVRGETKKTNSSFLRNWSLRVYRHAESPCEVRICFEHEFIKVGALGSNIESSGEDGLQTVQNLEKDFDDSDDEADELFFLKRDFKQDEQRETARYRQITVIQTAFTTYYALLIYLQSGFCHFSPLRSSASTQSAATRADFLSSAYDKDPSLSLPVSPKSLYRLAHLLDLDDLKVLSLAAAKRSLSPLNTAVNLFSNMSLVYDDLRKVVLDYAKENWEEVKASQGWNEKSREIKAGGAAEGGAGVDGGVELLRCAFHSFPFFSY